MRVFITGGAGFVGSHLSEAFLERGDAVSVLDNLSTGSIDNIAHLKGHPAFSYTIDSVDNEPLLAELIDRADVVVHLAAAVGVKLIVERPVHTIETNVHGTEIVLKHANKKKKLVLIASTSEVEKTTTSLPFLLACVSTTSVPCTFVSIVRTGASTMSFTPTAAARWTTVSHRSTISASSGSLVTESIV